jgi:tRNA-2-methylthio-N6-dimethylallyladenosine synthase
VTNSGKSLYIETTGCQMNVLDSELVVGELLRQGYAPTPDMHAADVVVLNTCSVRQHAEDKIWSRIGALRHTTARKPDRIVAVIGCMAERDGDSIMQRATNVDVLCGPSELNRLPGLIADVAATRAKAVALSGRLRSSTTPVRHAGDHADLESLDASRAGRAEVLGAGAMPGSPFQAYVRITRGCNKFCTYCVVPMTRGLEQHRPPDQIVAETARLAATGVREVTLLGQTVNHYVYEDDRGRRTTFADLLRRVHDEVPDLSRLRFVTSFPRDFTDDALRAMAESPRICKYLHIPAQSGSNRMLKLMNRGYTVEEYRGLLDRARALMPDLCIAGDMIVGFPTETDADFAASVDLLRYAKYKNCFIFKYSPRPGTAAFEKMTDDVSDEVKRRRNNDLLAVQAEVNMANHRALHGRSVDVLIEGPSKHTLRQQESEQSRGEEVEFSHAAVRRGIGGSGNGRTHAARREAALATDGPIQWVGRTSGDQIVVFDGPAALMGEIRPVEIVASTPYTLHGRLLDDSPGCARPGAESDVVTGGIALPILTAR